MNLSDRKRKTFLGNNMTKIVALAGGVGGAKLVLGLSKIIPENDFTVIINTGDDFVHYGLYICPDLDTVMYTLAGESNELNGWGRKNETWNNQKELLKISSDAWFNLGDRDLAVHMERTKLLREGNNLTEVTQNICEKYTNLKSLFPMSDQPVSTIIDTEEYGEISFQEYFVKYHFEPKYKKHYCKGIEKARINPKTRQKLLEADVVILCPSNPWLSIMPILAVEDMQKIISTKKCIAVSPIVGNSAIKGPAAKMLIEMGITPSASEVAKLYTGLIRGFVLDNKNCYEKGTIQGWGIIPLVTDTIMRDEETKKRLAQEIINFASQL
jgi:LPPG:FO 2-phospho-L-lactate transferase